jgi:hypothetical protein
MSDQGAARRPTEVTDDYWLWVDDGSEPNEPSGKWMVFCPLDKVDDVWQSVRTAVLAGRLGGAAKVATARPNPNQYNSNQLPIMIYTRADDLEEIGRVLVELRALGISQGLPYKGDATTLSGAYGRGVSSYYSRAGRSDFEERRPRG